MLEYSSFKSAVQDRHSTNTFNPSTLEAEEEGSYMSLRPSWATEFQVSMVYTGKPRLKANKRGNKTVQSNTLLRQTSISLMLFFKRHAKFIERQ